MFMDVDPLTATAGELLASVVDDEPSPMLMSVLLMVDRSALSPEDAVTWLQCHERVASWWSSLQVDALVAAADPVARVDEFWVLVPGSDEERQLRIADVVREELACAVRLSPVTAQRRIDTARLLHGPLTRTHEALSWGEISPSQVSVIVEARRRLPGFFQRDDAETVTFAAATAVLQDRVLPVARRGNLS
jgi:hypothetical protein